MARLCRPEGASEKRLQLLSEIETALAPWLLDTKTTLALGQNTSKKPPLSLEQLFVIAALFKPNSRLPEITRWIIGHIAYYRNFALDAFVESTKPDTRLYTDLHFDFTYELRWAPWSLDVPVNVSPEGRKGHEDCLFTAVDREARHFLQNILPCTLGLQQRQMPFSFLRLPADLRLYIYELTLAMPRSGISKPPDRYTDDRTLKVATKDFQDKDPSLWISMHELPREHRVFKGGPLEEHLAVLLTNKQIYREAMPVFYRINSFVCKGRRQLQNFLDNISEHRKLYIRDLTVVFWPPTCDEAHKLLLSLQSLTGLRRLCFVLTRRRFRRAQNRWGLLFRPARQRESGSGETWIRPHQRPALEVLKALRGLDKVEINGECEDLCDEMRELLEPDKMMQPREPLVCEGDSELVVQENAKLHADLQ